MKIEYQCCFCKQSIEKGVCAVNLVVNWDIEDNQRGQTFFCHPECFVKTTGEEIHVLEDENDSKNH